jgi:hypothetical protein
MPPRDAPDLTVFITSCDACHEDLGRGAWITLGEGGRAFCLACADLDRLESLPAGDAALTRRARAYSTLSAVVMRWSRARKRYERRGLLVEAAALALAETACLSDADGRSRRREREAERRDQLDRDDLASFADRLRELFPGIPTGRERDIADHACRKYSDRVGRSAAAKALDAEAVRLAVAAHVRHRERLDRVLLERPKRRVLQRADRGRGGPALSVDEPLRGLAAPAAPRGS